MRLFDVGMVERGLRGTRFAETVRHLRTVGSTNVLAMEAAAAGVQAGVWVADEQTAGRGRGGHGWHSAAGDGLYVSALLVPAERLTAEQALPISLAAGMAVQAAIAQVSGLRPDIRWPNDLLLNGRKCGGILVETALGAAGHGAPLRHAVIGMGVNLNHPEFPEELREVATSVRLETGQEVAREILLVALLRALDHEMGRLEREATGLRDGPGVLDRFAMASTWVRGKRVRVGEDGGYTGVTAGLDARGFLRVEGDDGVWHTVLSGGVRELVGP